VQYVHARRLDSIISERSDGVEVKSNDRVQCSGHKSHQTYAFSDVEVSRLPTSVTPPWPSTFANVTTVIGQPGSIDCENPPEVRKETTLDPPWGWSPLELFNACEVKLLHGSASVLGAAASPRMYALAFKLASSVLQ